MIGRLVSSYCVKECTAYHVPAPVGDGVAVKMIVAGLCHVA